MKDTYTFVYGRDYFNAEYPGAEERISIKAHPTCRKMSHRGKEHFGVCEARSC